MADGQSIYKGLLDRGFTAPQAAALAGNIQQESSFNPNAYNKGSDAQGLMQWRLDRKTGLSDYAKATGRDPSDPEAQLDYIVHEMTGPEAKNSAAFLKSGDVQTANDALKQFIRYGSNEGGKRLDYAMSFANQPGENQPPSSGPQPGFVNPSFSGAMPTVPSFGTAPAAGGVPAAPQAAPDAPPASPAMSDADLMKAFLPGGAPAATGTTAGAPSSDDEFLKQFLPTAEQKAAAAQADPLAAAAPQLFPGADALSAGFTSAVDAIPVIGHPMMNALTGFKGSLYGRTPDQQAAIEQEIRDQQPVASTTGTVVGNVAPLLALGGVPGVGRALGMSGNLLTRMVMGGTSSAALEGADTLTRGGSLEDAGKNALLAGGLGAGAAPVADVIGHGINKLLSGTAPEVAKLAQLARDKFGIPIGPGQISDNGMVRMADSVVNKMPLSGGTASSAAQQSAFNKAVANTFGENADHITTDVMARAKGRIGSDFETVAQKTPRIDYDPQIEGDLIRITDDANKVLTAPEIGPLKAQIDDIVGKFGQGQNGISGDVYQALTRKGAPLDRLLSSGDPNIKFYAGQVREALDEALSRYAPQDAQTLLKQARSQWKAMKTIEPLAEKATTGDISAPLLMNQVRGSYGDMAYGGGGDLADLARIGQQFLKAPPSSGTAERLAVMEVGKKLLGPTGLAGAGVAAAMNPGAIPLALATGVPALAAYAATAKGAGALLRSKTLANKLIENSLGQTPKATGGVTNRLLRSGVPLATPRQPVQIIVRPGANASGNRLLAQ